MRATSMPTSRAPSGSSASARMALPDVGAAQEGEQRQRHDHGPAARHQPRHLHQRLAEQERGAGVARPHGAEVALPEHEGQVLEEERQPEGEQELVVLGRERGWAR